MAATELGAAIRLIRKRADRSQGVFGSLLGHRQDAVSKFERGAQTPRKSVLMRIADLGSEVALTDPSEKLAAAIGVVTAEARKVNESCLDEVKRLRATLRAIADSTLTGAEFGDWVQAACEDALDGRWPECPHCETAVHDGRCVDQDGAKLRMSTGGAL